MGHTLITVEEEIGKMTASLIQQQRQDGSWHYCFENGTTIDAFIIILFRILNVPNEPLIRQLHDRILAEQLPEGCWKLYVDEGEGNLSVSVENYYALLCSGYSQSADEPIQRAKRFILSKGGLGKVTSVLTKAILAATGQRKWPAGILMIPLEILLFPSSFPMNIFEFSGYSRVHLIPMLVMADRHFSIKSELIPDLSDLNDPRNDSDKQPSIESRQIHADIQRGMNRLIGTPRFIHEAATAKAEEFMLKRIEKDGTLYSYASSTILMVLAFLALGYDKEHSIITDAVQGLTELQYSFDGKTTIQNSPSTVWDTALIAYTLQEAAGNDNHAAVRRAGVYLLSRQQNQSGDWSIHNPGILPGGWGFSESNTINPDVDDSTAALRAIHTLSQTDPTYMDSWNRGLSWVLSMQNKDGGWPSFEKNTNKEILTWLAIDGAKSAAIDPSEADLTGRTLEFLGNFCGLGIRHEFIQRGMKWLMKHQEKDGSWYGRWGICYIYGTWAALTGLTAVGLSTDNDTLQKGAKWLLSIQNQDGGWGESCSSDRTMRYEPLGESTPSQTAWALDALISVHPRPTAAINKGIHRLIASVKEHHWTTAYPEGAGLPGSYYTHYHSYRHIWPLLALSHYKRKYGDI